MKKLLIVLFVIVTLFESCGVEYMNMRPYKIPKRDGRERFLKVNYDRQGYRRFHTLGF
jgi:hypothetical protein